MNKLLMFCLLLSLGSASAALNKWVDAQGNVHYSDNKPPPNVESKTLRSASESKYINTDEDEDETDENLIEESSGNALQSIAERQAERQRAKLEKQEADAKTAKEQADAESMKSYCKSARENLKALKDGIRLIEVDANGERSFINDNQRQKKVIQIQQDISKHCN